MRRDERETAKIDAKENLKVKWFRDEVFDKLFFHDFLSRTNEAWLAIWFEQQLMKKQKKNEKMKRIRNVEDAKKIWKTAREKEKTKKTKFAICYSMIIFVLYARIHTHRVIERDEFSSSIDVDHDDAQNEACHRCWRFKVT